MVDIVSIDEKLKEFGFNEIRITPEDEKALWDKYYDEYIKIMRLGFSSIDAQGFILYYFALVTNRYVNGKSFIKANLGIEDERGVQVLKINGERIFLDKDEFEEYVKNNLIVEEQIRDYIQRNIIIKYRNNAHDKLEALREMNGTIESKQRVSFSDWRQKKKNFAQIQTIKKVWVEEYLESANIGKEIMKDLKFPSYVAYLAQKNGVPKVEGEDSLLAQEVKKRIEDILRLGVEMLIEDETRAKIKSIIDNNKSIVKNNYKEGNDIIGIYSDYDSIMHLLFSELDGYYLKLMRRKQQQDLIIGDLQKLDELASTEVSSYQ